MAVIIVDVFEIIDVEKGQREPGDGAVMLHQAVGAVFDHPAHRQVGQFVKIGRTEQMILDGFLLADIDGARQQQIAVRDTDRPMGREQYLLALATDGGFFHDGRAPSAEQFKTGLATVVQMFRGNRRRRPFAQAELRRGRIVDQQKLALLVLDRDAGREHPENIPQDVQFAVDSGLAVSWRRGVQVLSDRALHGGGGCQSLL